MGALDAAADPNGHVAVLGPGTVLGRYELIRRLAVGGMAELYLARATGIEGFEKLVALKRILPQHAANPEFVSMFLDEARLSAALQHANVAQVYDIGESSGSLYFTMEFVHGQDVRSILRRAYVARKRVPLAHALTMVTGAAAGLHAAHQLTDMDGAPLDIVHRDVTPSNVLVSFDGCVKLIDFGVAKAARRQTETRAGTLKGKVSYMSPEQCDGRPVDRRSDVFGLGIVLYELTTGRRLFGGDNDFHIMRRIVGEDAPPPSERIPGYPAELEAIVMRALARDPEARFATAQDMQLAIERFARGADLVLSTVALGRYLRQTFADRLDAWEEVRQEIASGSDSVEIEIEGTPEPALLPGGAVASAPPAPRAVNTAMFMHLDTPPPRRPQTPSGFGRHTMKLAVIGAFLFGAIAVAAFLRFGGAEPGPQSAPPRVAPALTAPAQAPAAQPEAEPRIIERPKAPPNREARVEPRQAGPAVEPRVDGAAPPKRVKRKKRRKRTPPRSFTRPTWDPNSALPPP